MAGPTSEVTRIRVPPASEHIATVRAFIGAVGRHFGCSEETIDDLRLAATETCAQALDEGTAPDGIEVRASYDTGRFVLEIEPAARFAPSPGADPLDPTSGDRRRALVSALFPDVRVLAADDDGTPSLRVTAPCEGAALEGT